MGKLRRGFFCILIFQAVVLFGQNCPPGMAFDGKKITLTPEQWRERLNPAQYRILREGKTEPPFMNEYNDNKRPGIYLCAACELPLFSSKVKYDSNTGWPSFWEPICPQNVSYLDDYSLFFIKRIEVICSRCESHLGHVFNDGPPPTGKRYCINSLALKFVPNMQ